VPQESLHAWISIDKTRVNTSIRHSKQEYKEKRRHRRKSKIKQLDAFKHSEGVMYKSGAFHANKDQAATSKPGQRKAPGVSVPPLQNPPLCIKVPPQQMINPGYMCFQQTYYVLNDQTMKRYNC
jgi:hypothetical protein